MTRTAGRTVPARRTGTDLEAWLLGDPQLDPDSVTLLAAYRAAADAAKSATPASAAPAQISDEPGPEVPQEPAALRVAPSVARLRAIEGIDDGRLAALHGQLLAAGYLTTELLGRADGLAYRLTREGLRRLAGEPDEAEAA